MAYVGMALRSPCLRQSSLLLCRLVRLPKSVLVGVHAFDIDALYSYGLCGYGPHKYDLETLINCLPSLVADPLSG